MVRLSELGRGGSIASAEDPRLASTNSHLEALLAEYSTPGSLAVVMCTPRTEGVFELHRKKQAGKGRPDVWGSDQEQQMKEAVLAARNGIVFLQSGKPTPIAGAGEDWGAWGAGGGSGATAG
jgi:hypothetical protein